MLYGLGEVAAYVGNVDEEDRSGKDAVDVLGRPSGRLRLGLRRREGCEVLDGAVALLQRKVNVGAPRGVATLKGLICRADSHHQVADWCVVDGRLHHLAAPKRCVEAATQHLGCVCLEVLEAPLLRYRVKKARV